MDGKEKREESQIIEHVVGLSVRKRANRFGFERVRQGGSACRPLVTTESNYIRRPWKFLTHWSGRETRAR